MDIEIESVELEKETQIIPEHINEKLEILDVRAKLSNGAVVDIEMQNINYGNIEKRITYYLNRLYTSELKKGKSYNDLNKPIAIGVLNFDYFKDIEQYHTKRVNKK